MKDKLYLQKGEGFPGEWISIVHRGIIEQWKKNGVGEGIFVTDAGYFPNAKGHFRERTDGIMENILIYCLDGGGVIEVGDETVSLNANEAYIIPAFEAHKYQADEKNPWSILWMHFGGNGNYWKKQNVRQTGMLSGTEYGNKHEMISGKRKVSDSMKQQIVTLFSFLREELRAPEPDGVSVLHLASLIIHDIFGKTAIDAVNDPPLLFEKIKGYMLENLSTELTINKLSIEFDVPESTLCALFKKHSGKGPIDFFTSLRMKEAEKLLRDSSLYIYQVAEQLGYKDQYYFSRVFTKYAGESPREYRKRGI